MTVNENGYESFEIGDKVKLRKKYFRNYQDKEFINSTFIVEDIYLEQKAYLRKKYSRTHSCFCVEFYKLKLER